MTPRDAMRCAGWSLQLAAWSLLTEWGQTTAAATARTGVDPVSGAWRRHPSGLGLTFVEGDATRLVGVREWVVAGEVTFAVGDGCVWALATAKEGR